MIIEAVAAGFGETVATGLADHFPASFVLVVGGDVAHQAGVQSHLVVEGPAVLQFTF